MKQHIYLLADSIGATIKVQGGLTSCSFKVQLKKGNKFRIPLPFHAVSGLFTDELAAVVIRGPGDLALLVASYYSASGHLFSALAVLDATKTEKLEGVLTSKKFKTIPEISAHLQDCTAARFTREGFDGDWKVEECPV